MTLFFNKEKVVRTTYVIFICLLWFFICLGYFGLSMFLPDMLNEFAPKWLDVYSEILIIRGCVVVGNFISWIGLAHKFAIPIFLFIGIAASLTIGVLDYTQTSTEMNIIFFTSLCILVTAIYAALGKLTVISVTAFPTTTIRAMSIGFLMLCGRIGACIGATISGYLSDNDMFYGTWALSFISFIFFCIYCSNFNSPTKIKNHNTLNI